MTLSHRTTRPLAAFALLLFASLAAAQPKPALVQDRDEPGRSPFQQRVITSDCQGQIICAIELGTTVPAGKRLVVTQLAVGFRVTVSANATPVLAALAATGGGFSLPFAITGADVYRYALLPMTFYFEAGQTPVLFISVSEGTFNLSQEYALVGYLIDVP